MIFAMILSLAVGETPRSPAGGHPICARTDAVTPPGDRLETLDRFRAGLSAADRRRLDLALPRSADGGIARCDAVEGSRASCEASAYMPALRKSGLMHRYLASVRSCGGLQ